MRAKSEIKGEFSNLLSHDWREDERGDGMPVINCFYCGESRSAGIAGMGLRFGPKFNYEQPSREYCREASIAEARRRNTATTKPLSSYHPYFDVSNEKYQKPL